MDADLDSARRAAGPLQLVTDKRACRAGFRDWQESLISAAEEEEDCYRVGRMGLRAIRFDKAGRSAEFWLDQIPHAAVQINEPTDPSTENGLSAIAVDDAGRRYLVRQAWLQKNKASPAIRDAQFAALTGLPTVSVRLGRGPASRQWHIVTPIDGVPAERLARFTADFVARCWMARAAVAGEDSGRDADGLDETDRAGVARLLEKIAQPGVAAALQFLIDTTAAAGFRFVFRRSTAVAGVEFQDATRRNLYSLIANPDHLLFYLRQPAQQRVPGMWDKAVARFGPQTPNARGEYRIPLGSLAEAEQLIAWLREIDAWGRIITPVQGRTRLPAAAFEAVTADHLLAAARRLADGFDDHPFGPSTDYDVLFEGGRLPPEAVFGLAATAALGRPIGPGDFSGGLGTPCFRALGEAGYVILPKGEADPGDPALSPDDRQWVEGDARLVTHLQRERGQGLSAAKRAQFVALHGKLFCERCDLDPVAHFGSEAGAACIEVHHHKVAVADMAAGHRTELDDLQCLCANCHRVVHRELKLQAATAGARAR